MATDTTHSHQSHGQSHGQAQHGRLHDAREAATHAFDTTRETAADAARRAAAGLETNPLGVLIGGLAVGVLAGAVIPRSAREKELLGPLGQQLGSRARTAFEAARSAGMDELDSRGLTKDGIRDQARGLLDGVGKALSSAGSAAVKTSSTNSG